MARSLVRAASLSEQLFDILREEIESGALNQVRSL